MEQLRERIRYLYLANARKVAASTHKQALSALLFFYTKVLNVNLPWLNEIGRPNAPRRLPVVLTREEVSAIFLRIDSLEQRTFAQLLYGTGLRINEALQLRIKDIEFSHNAIIVRDGKGMIDRVVMLPQTLHQNLNQRILRARCIWELDRAANANGVYLPFALERKYPNAGKTWGWFWLFPQASEFHRVQELLGHSDVATTMIYTHVLNIAGRGVKSPLDLLPHQLLDRKNLRSRHLPCRGESTHRASMLSQHRATIGIRIPMLVSSLGRAWLRWCADGEREATPAILRNRTDPKKRLRSESRRVCSGVQRDRDWISSA
jgi:integrase